MNVRFLLAVGLMAGSAVFFAGCSREKTAEAETTTVKVEPAPDPDIFDPKHPEEFPLVKVETSRVADQLQTNGVVAPDVERTVHVTSLSGGRVVDIRARLGDSVKRGQVLLVINSADLAGAIADYKKAVADEALTRKALDRANVLYSHGAMAQKDLEQAEDAETKAKVDVSTAAEHIRLLGGDLNSLSPVIEVRSPISGAIVEQNTAGGEGVKSLDNSPSLFTIADLSRVWVLCDVYENDLSQVHVGDYAGVTLNAYPDRPLRGRVDNISQVLDPSTRTAKVRLELANPGGLMRPGMFATVQFTSQRSHERMLLPASAILRLHDKDWVFRKEDGHQFRRTEVSAGAGMPEGRQEILAGIRPGDEVVANALQFSNSMEQM